MFDFLAKLAEILIEGLSTYSEKKIQAKKQKFGRDLVGCYLALMDITKLGWEICEYLEQLALNYDELDHSPRRDLIWGLRERLAWQATNLRQLSYSMEQLHTALKVLDPDLRHRLYLSAERKGFLVEQLSSVISSLAWTLKEDKLPASFDIYSWSQQPVVVAHGHVVSGIVWFDDGDWMRLSEYSGQQARHGDNIKGYIYLKPSGDAKLDIQTVRDYLANAQPKERLEELANYTMQLRDFLIAHFNFEEILWSVNLSDKKRNNSSS
jgi:hypothetical protein